MATYENAQIEVTDTFNSEANYSWVRRYEIKRTEGKSMLAITRAVKKLIGWNGIRCDVSQFGDITELRPRGMNQVCFVTFNAYGNASN